MISNQLAGSTECFDASAALSIVSDYSCVDNTGNISKVQIHRATGDFELASIDIQLAAGGTTKTYPNSTIPGVNGDKVYTIDFGTDFTEKVTEVSVAAVVTTGSTTETCGASGMATLRACTA